MFQRTVAREVTNSEAKMALTILNDYYKLVISPRYKAKIKALPDKRSYEIIARRYQSRSIHVHSALINLQIEIESVKCES